MLDGAAIYTVQTMRAVMQLLAGLYRNRLDEAVARGIAEMDLADVDGDVVLDNALCAEGLAVMRRFCKGENALAQASTDFHNLFVGPHELLAAPWSSVYLDTGGLVFGQTALKVKALFAEQGLAIPEGNAEPSDHVAYEWQFMADLHGRAAAALEGGDAEAARGQLAIARRFLADYLAPWMEPFCAAVLNGATTRFYAGLATFTRGLVEVESSVLEDLLKEA